MSNSNTPSIYRLGSRFESWDLCSLVGQTGNGYPILGLRTRSGDSKSELKSNRNVIKPRNIGHESILFKERDGSTKKYDGTDKFISWRERRILLTGVKTIIRSGWSLSVTAGSHLSRHTTLTRWTHARHHLSKTSLPFIIYVRHLSIIVLTHFSRRRRIVVHGRWLSYSHCFLRRYTLHSRWGRIHWEDV